jgi:DNA-binding response OmpR family regulator/HPt (histidine-containing phosphotransfer) domain-containing protein
MAGLPDRLAAWLAQRLDDAVVQVTYTGDDALDQLEDGTWSLLVIDAAIEGLPAEEVVRRMRGNRSLASLPVVLVAGTGEGEADEGALQRMVSELRIDRILLAPVDRGELARHAATLIARPAATEPPPAESRAPSTAAAPSGQPPTSAANAAAEAVSLNSALAAVWERSLPSVVARVDVIEKAVTAAMLGALTAADRETAEREAHRLAGALGTFGLQQGSVLARQIEHALSATSSFSRDDASRLSGTAAALRREVVSRGGASPEPAASAEPMPASTASSASASPVLAVPPPASSASTSSASTSPASASHVASPSAPAGQPASPVPTEASAAGGDAGTTLLVIHDDAALVRALEAEGRGRGVRVRSATLANARGALAAERPHAVLFDLTGEEEGTAWALLAEVGRSMPGVPVLVSAARDSLLDRVRIVQLGARVFLQDPLVPAEVMDAVARVVPRTGAAGETRVLAVDDDPSILSAVRALLEPQRLTVHTLDTPLRFWSTLRSVQPHLLILDVDMPHLNGIELCRVVRADHRWAALPILFLTARTDAETILRVFAAGADDYVTKPVVGPELSARIHNRLVRSAPRP